MHPRAARLLALALLSLLAAPGSTEAARRVLVIEGRAVDQDGIPVGGVRIEAAGSRQATATTNRSGEFSLPLALPHASELARAPLSITVRAARAGWRFALADAEGDLGLEVQVERTATGGARCLARSNDARVAAGAARVVSLDGDVTAVAAVNFRGQRGEAVASPPPKLEQVAKVALTGGMPIVETARAGPSAADPLAPAATASPAPPTVSPAPAATPANPPSSAPRAAAARPDTAQRPPTRAATVEAAAESAQALRSRRVIPPAPPGARERSAPLLIRRPPWPFPPEAAAESCLCRVEGTIEVSSRRPLSSRVPVIASIEGQPQHADSVELFMGPPRRFLLTRVPCGRHALRLDIRSPLEFEVVSRDSLGGFTCEPGGVRQLRIALRPH